ncbi:MAG: 3-hydroxybutyryl-CoA dehydrogenase [Deltaproteobacteria bacterium CG11_big_fil_rev_8_21_14_0_20_45_16]|nr:MAG: 3-hydroxybutyryl-CoA dehydrogenase [Deltaproteobacteria bacterium CG11_big_fil_rev_8_21_14_0_20_45_16]
MNFKKIAVIGSGQMGSGIAQVLASHSADVFLFDISGDQLKKAKAGIEKSLSKLQEKGRLQEEPSKVMERIQLIDQMEGVASAELAIEAATENFAIKCEIFKKLDQILPSSSILASNTSSISITKLAAITNRPEKFVGVHFMNPVPIMKLVELISGQLTSSDTMTRMEALVAAIDKTGTKSADYPGFVVNRILMPMINEAIFALYEGVGCKEAIDTGMKLGTNHPMGPLELADFIGLDTCLAIMEVLHEGLGDSKYRACPLLKNYVAAGLLGRKSGRGFYEYPQK